MPLLPAFEARLNLRHDRLCLDLANTVGNHASAEPSEGLENYADLLDWTAHLRLLPPAAAEQLRAQAERHPAAAQAALARVVELREALYRLFLAHVHGHAPAAADLAALNMALQASLAHARLIPAEGSYALDWDLAAAADLDSVLWPMVYSAADLLATPEQLARLGQCQDDRGCGWLFLDLTKNHSRRWCAMGDCGNRAKAKRHYERQKSTV